MKERRAPPSSYFASKPIACNSCRRSKLKCDRLKPCGSCVARGTESLCYRDKSVGAGDIGEESPFGTASTDRPLSVNASALEEVTAALRSQQQTLSSLATLISSDGESSRRHSLTSWKAEVLNSLPSMTDCDILLSFYYEELYIYGGTIDRQPLLQILDRIQQSLPILSAEASILLLILATAALMFPARHPARPRLSCPISTQHEIWPSLADRLTAKSRIKKPIQPREYNISSDILLDVALEMSFAAYFNSAGRNDEMWDALGTAVRKGASIAIFDERHAQWRGLGEGEKQQRKRLGLGIALMDAWASFNRMRPPGIHPSLIHLQYNDSKKMTKERSFIGIMDPRQLPIVHRSREFLLAYNDLSPLQRYSEATSIVNEIHLAKISILADVENRKIESPVYIESHGIKQVQMLVCTSTPAYLACVITRRFLTDDNAPDSLRFQSLVHAQDILSIIPTLTPILQEMKLPLNPSWNASQLLCAASAFSVILLGVDYYLDVNLTSAYQNSYEASSNTQSISNLPMCMHPQIRLHFEWLTGCIFNILDCLDIIQASTANRMAILCKQILESLCRLDVRLNEALKQRNNAASADWSSTTIPNKSSVHFEEALTLIDLVWPVSKDGDSSSHMTQQILASFCPTSIDDA